MYTDSTTARPAPEVQPDLFGVVTPAPAPRPARPLSIEPKWFTLPKTQKAHRCTDCVREARASWDAGVTRLRHPVRAARYRLEVGGEALYLCGADATSRGHVNTGTRKSTKAVTR